MRTPGCFRARNLLVVLVVAVMIATALATGCDTVRLGSWVAIEFGAAAVGALLGFLIGVPGQSPVSQVPTEQPDAVTLTALTHAVNATVGSVQRNRISVFSDWLVGGAFALALANGGTILRAVDEATRRVVAANPDKLDEAARLQQAALVSFSVCFLVAAFIVAWWQTATNGYRLLTKVGL